MTTQYHYCRWIYYLQLLWRNIIACSDNNLTDWKRAYKDKWDYIWEGLNLNVSVFHLLAVCLRTRSVVLIAKSLQSDLLQRTACFVRLFWALNRPSTVQHRPVVRAWIIICSSSMQECNEYLMCLVYEKVAQGREACIVNGSSLKDRRWGLTEESCREEETSMNHHAERSQRISQLWTGMEGHERNIAGLTLLSSTSLYTAHDDKMQADVSNYLSHISQYKLNCCSHTKKNIYSTVCSIQ